MKNKADSTTATKTNNNNNITDIGQDLKTVGDQCTILKGILESKSPQKRVDNIHDIFNDFLKKIGDLTSKLRHERKDAEGMAHRLQKMRKTMNPEDFDADHFNEFDVAWNEFKNQVLYSAGVLKDQSYSPELRSEMEKRDELPAGVRKKMTIDKLKKRQKLEKIRNKYWQDILRARKEEDSEADTIRGNLPHKSESNEDDRSNTEIEVTIAEDNTNAEAKSKIDEDEITSQPLTKKNCAEVPAALPRSPVERSKDSTLYYLDVDTSLRDRSRILQKSMRLDEPATISPCTAGQFFKQMCSFLIVFIFLCVTYRLFRAIHSTLDVSLDDCVQANYFCEHFFKCCFSDCGASRLKVFRSKLF
uniref:Uncharacterized protein n=1 Tax=Romanomermis culicivorax TaxID=13658 RepID=A0A915KB86_ROMCU